MRHLAVAAFAAAVAAGTVGAACAQNTPLVGGFFSPGVFIPPTSCAGLPPGAAYLDTDGLVKGCANGVAPPLTANDDSTRLTADDGTTPLEAL